MCQLPVVGDQQQALAVGVEPPDVEQAGCVVGHQVRDGRSAPVVRHRRQHPDRLVQREVNQARLGHDPCAVDLDDRGLRVDPKALRLDDPAVHPHAARGDQLLAVPPGPEPRRRENLLQPDALGIHVTGCHEPRMS